MFKQFICLRWTGHFNRKFSSLPHIVRIDCIPECHQEMCTRRERRIPVKLAGTYTSIPPLSTRAERLANPEQGEIISTRIRFVEEKRFANNGCRNKTNSSWWFPKRILLIEEKSILKNNFGGGADAEEEEEEDGLALKLLSSLVLILNSN